MPEGMDPADTIVKSQAQWEACVLDAKDYLDYRLEIFNRTHRSFEEKKALVEKDLFTFVALTKSSMLQDRMLQKIALFLGVSTESVRSDFKNLIPKTLPRCIRGTWKKSIFCESFTTRANSISLCILKR